MVIDTRFFAGATYDLSGHYIKNNNGDRFNFPAGTILRPGTPIRVYTGSGTNSATELYWGRNAAYANLGDCAQLFFPNGTFYLMAIAVACR